MGPWVRFSILDGKWVLTWGLFPVRRRFFDTEEEARKGIRKVLKQHVMDYAKYFEIREYVRKIRLRG